RDSSSVSCSAAANTALAIGFGAWYARRLSRGRRRVGISSARKLSAGKARAVLRPEWDDTPAPRCLDLPGERSRYDVLSVEHRPRLRVAAPARIEFQGPASVVDHEFSRCSPDDAGRVTAGDRARTVRGGRARTTQAGRSQAAGRNGRTAGSRAGGGSAAAKPGREQSTRLHTAGRCRIP